MNLKKLLLPVALSIGALFMGTSKAEAQTVVTVGIGTATTNGINGLPIYRSSAASTFNYSRSASLYTTSDLSSIPNGAIITAIAFNKTSAASLRSGYTATFNILLKNTANTVLNSTTDWATFITGATTAYTTATLDSATFSATPWVSFPLSTSFVYTGGSLEIYTDWAINSSSGTGTNYTTAAFPFAYTTTTGVQSAGNSNSTALTGTTVLSGTNSRLNNIQITYSPPPTCTGTPLAGTANTSATAGICSGNGITVSLTGGSAASSLSYQLQSSTNNTTFANVGTSATIPNFSIASVPGTTYYRIVTTCTASNQSANSASVTVSALGPITTFPYTDTFSSSGLPSCWSASAGSGASVNWTGATADASNGVAGPQSSAAFVKLNVYNASASYNPYILNSRSYILSAPSKQIQYYYFLGNGGYKGTTGATGTDPYPMVVLGTKDGGTTYDTLYKHSSANSVLATTTAISNWTLNTIILPASYAGQTVQFRIVSTSNFGNGICNQAIDEFKVNDAPACQAPTAITTSALTSNNVTLSWTAPAAAPSNGYQYEVRTSGAAGSGTTGLANSGATAAGITTAMATGLSSLTTYTVYVRGNCGGTFSAWTTGVSFYTPCTTPMVSTTAPATRCGVGTTSLSATGTGNTLFWYRNSTTDTILANVSPFTTPVISATTTYYVAAVSTTSYTGLGNTTIPTSSTGNTSQKGIVVRTLQPFILNTAQFYSTLTTGTIAGTATLVDSATGSTVVSTPFSFAAGSAAQWYTMNLNWNLAAGKTYRLLASFSSGSVSLHNSGVDYSLSAYNNLSPVGTITSGYDFGNTSSSYSYFHNLAVTSVCASARTAVTATVTAPPAITVSAATTICEASSATLTATSANAGYTYTWTPATTPATGASVMASPVVTTKYFVNAVDNSTGANAGCGTRDSVLVTVNPRPTAPVVMPSVAASFCLGDTVTLSATGSLISLFSENFNGTTISMTNVDINSTVTPPAKGAWLVKGIGYSYNSSSFNSPTNTPFIMANSDSAGSGTTNVALISPVISTAGFANLILVFNHYYRTYSGDSALVEASSNGGSTWTFVKNFNTGSTIGTATAFQSDTANLSAFGGQTNMKFRIRYRSDYGWYWAVDDVRLLSTSSIPLAWSSNPTANSGLPVSAGTSGTGNTIIKATPTAAGAYTYTAVLTAGNGCTRTVSTGAVTVNPLPIVNLGNDTSFCSGNSITLNAGNTGSSYLWSTGATTQTVVATATGTYSVRVTNTNGCIGRDTISLTVNPSLTVNLGNDTAFCIGNSITLNAGNAGASYLWSTGATTQTIVASTTGAYSVRVTNSSNCTARDTVNILVNPLPVGNLGNDTSFCAGNSITLNAGNTGSSYLWSTGATTQTIAISATGSYNVRVINTNGCTGRDTVNITVKPSPVVALGNDTTFCEGSPVILNAGNSTAGTLYQWNTGATTSTIAALLAGPYTVRVTYPNGCIRRDTITLMRNPLPDAGTITVSGQSPTFTFTATGNQNDDLRGWKFGDGTTDATGNSTTSTHTYTASGTYRVTFYVVNSCGADSIKTTVVVTSLGVNNILLNGDLTLFPNPASEFVTLKNTSTQDMKHVTVLNALGAVVREIEATNAKEQRINISGLAAGSYLIRVQLNGATVLRRLQITK